MGNKKHATSFATCCRTSWIAMLHILPSTFEPFLLQIRLQGLFSWVVKCTTSLFNSFCSKVTKQVAHFLLPIVPYLNYQCTRCPVHVVHVYLTCRPFLGLIITWQIYYINTRGGEGVLPYITYMGMCRPTGSWFWSSWFRTGVSISEAFSRTGYNSNF